MADEVDIANEVAELRLQKQLKNHFDKAAAIEEGTEGECDLCGNYSGRLVRGACAPCRDKYKLG
jgi:hypothetical protein